MNQRRPSRGSPDSPFGSIRKDPLPGSLGENGSPPVTDQHTWQPSNRPPFHAERSGKDKQGR